MTRSMMLRLFYLAAAVVGTVVPWVFFASYFAVSGIEASRIIQSLFANGAASGFVSDVLISIIVFWIWSWDDAKRRRVKYWWLVIPAGFFVGLSLAMPLYFFFREISTGPDVRLTRPPR